MAPASAPAVSGDGAARDIVFDLKVFALATVKKALYRFADRCAFGLAVAGDRLTVSCTPRKPLSEAAWAELKAQIENEVLDQDLRETLGRETEQVRLLILANAFSRTGLVD